MVFLKPLQHSYVRLPERPPLLLEPLQSKDAPLAPVLAQVPEGPLQEARWDCLEADSTANAICLAGEHMWLGAWKFPLKLWWED